MNCFDLFKCGASNIRLYPLTEQLYSCHKKVSTPSGPASGLITMIPLQEVPMLTLMPTPLTYGIICSSKYKKVKKNFGLKLREKIQCLNSLVICGS